MCAKDVLRDPVCRERRRLQSVKIRLGKVRLWARQREKGSGERGRRGTVMWLIDSGVGRGVVGKMQRG